MGDSLIPLCWPFHMVVMCSVGFLRVQSILYRDKHYIDCSQLNSN